MLVFFFSSKKDDEDEREEKKKKHIVVSRQNNRSGNVGIFEADLPRLVVGSDLLLRSRRPNIREGGPAASLYWTVGGIRFFFPLCVPHSSTCENRIVFCLRNVYVWTSVLSLDKSIEKEKKIFPFSHSYSFFFSFSAATTERGPSSNDPSHGYSNGWLFHETISLLPHIDIEAPTRCTRCSSYSVSRKIGFFFLADILWNIWRRDGWCHLISGPDQQQQQRASI